MEDEVIMFHLEDDNEAYYSLSQEDMQTFAEDEGREVESWGIATNGLPDGALKIRTYGYAIYINYGIR